VEENERTWVKWIVPTLGANAATLGAGPHEFRYNVGRMWHAVHGDYPTIAGIVLVNDNDYNVTPTTAARSFGGRSGIRGGIVTTRRRRSRGSCSRSICPGQYRDEETGLASNWYRYYDPSTGRYLARDSANQFGGAMRSYTYAYGWTPNAFDPDGREVPPPIPPPLVGPVLVPAGGALVGYAAGTGTRSALQGLERSDDGTRGWLDLRASLRSARVVSLLEVCLADAGGKDIESLQ
ncbi:MAG: hypothetical protein IT381_29800, partial [Deltaproteobacteria bacterium]|nr:hypothetical protein [Deltaproteobacteria bacterium]